MRVRLLLVLLGAWIALSFAMGAVATVNFRTVDRVLAPGYRPELVLRIAPRTPLEERPILRLLASEINRRFFRLWALAQLALAAALLALVLPEPALGLAGRVLAGAAAALTAVLGLVLTPAARRLGPPLDFVPRPFPPEWQDAARRFFRLHGAYLGLDLLKIAVLAALLVLALRAREPRRSWDVVPGG